MINEKVSIIVPVYNVEKYLTHCLDTLRNQSYRNIEIILVDDGSTDRSGAICDQYQQVDSRIRVIHKENGGLSSARNAGIQIATGEYFSFVDSDDWVSVYMIETLLDAVVETNSDIAVCGFFCVKENDISPDAMDGTIRVMNKETAVEELINWKIRDYAWNKLYARKLFNDILYPVGHNYEDMFTTYRLFLKSNQIVQIPDILYYYRIRSGSIANEARQEKLLKNKLDALQAYSERIHNISCVIPKLRRLVVEKFFQRFIDYMLYIDCIYKGDQIISHKYRKKVMELGKKYISQTSGIDKRLYIKTLIILYTDNIFFVFYNKIKTILHLFPEPVKSVKGKIKNTIRGFRKRKCTIQLPKQPCAFLIGTPEHDNLGDHAIAYATERMLVKLFGNRIIEITEEQYLSNHRRIKKMVRKKDLILIQGGGNWGNTYKYIAKIHRLILKELKKQQIIVMPQTVYYTPDAIGEKNKKKDGILLKKCNKIIFFCREKKSLCFFQKEFREIDCNFTPDLVLSLNMVTNVKRKGCLFCIRNDLESALSAMDKIVLLNTLEREGFRVTVTDTSNGIRVNPEQREKALQAKWKQFQQAELVLTDRLHGLIFSYITGTPCIVLGNYNHKVQAAYSMISKYAKNIVFINSVQELQEALYKVTRIGAYNQLEKDAFNYSLLIQTLQKAGIK